MNDRRRGRSGLRIRDGVAGMNGEYKKANKYNIDSLTLWKQRDDPPSSIEVEERICRRTPGYNIQPFSKTKGGDFSHRRRTLCVAPILSTPLCGATLAKTRGFSSL